MTTLSLWSNWAVAFAYFCITWRLHVLHKRGVWPFANTIAFKMFIFLCGVHHLVMPLGYVALTNGIDLGLAIVSVGCAFFIWRDSRAAPR